MIKRSVLGGGRSSRVWRVGERALTSSPSKAFLHRFLWGTLTVEDCGVTGRCRAQEAAGMGRTWKCLPRQSLQPRAADRQTVSNRGG